MTLSVFILAVIRAQTCNLGIYMLQYRQIIGTKEVIMNIRNAVSADLRRICEVYDIARQFMRNTGNPTQWSDGYPQLPLLQEDIAGGNLYVAEHDGLVTGVFALFTGADPTYSYIEGQWLNDAPYATIHRIASDGTQKGLLRSAAEYALGIFGNVRIDTHHDNKVMQHLLETLGFTRCGIIYLENGDPRIAYQKTI